MTRENPVEALSKSIESEGLLLTLHAADKMIDENISTKEVKQAILKGT